MRASKRTQWLHASVQHTFFSEELSITLASYGIDVGAEADRIAPVVLDDPAFRSALTDLVIETHERVLLEPSDEPLDMTAITSAVRATIVREVPGADAVLPDSSTLYIVTADQIPDLTGPIDVLDRAALTAAIGALLLAWINEQLEVPGSVTFTGGGWGDPEERLVDVSDRL